MKFNQNDKERISHLLPRFLDNANHVIKLYENEGDIPKGQVDPSDVIDTIISRIQNHLSTSQNDQEIYGLISQKTVNFVRALNSHYRDRAEKELSTDELVSIFDDMDRLVGQGDEILNFFVADELLHREDIIPDFNALSPEDEASKTEEFSRGSYD